MVEGVWSVVEGVWSVVESHVVFPPPLHVPVVCSCQTYEGGFSGVPWSEAHGGYTFCAVASLAILGAMQRADVDALKVGVPPHPAHCTLPKPRAWCMEFASGRCGVFGIIREFVLCRTALRKRVGRTRCLKVSSCPPPPTSCP